MEKIEKEGMEMSRLRVFVLVSAALLISVAVPSLMFAADPDPYIEEDFFASTSVYVGCTLGNDWSGFPTRMYPDYVNTSASEKLDVTLPLYVTWIMYQDSTKEAVAVDPPQPITNYDWFDGFYDEFEVVLASVQDHVRYNQCASGNDLEAPSLNSYPLNSSGELHVEDVHGGIGTTTLMILRRFTNEQHTQGVRVYIGWSSPATRYDEVEQQDLNFTPGEVWRRAARFTIPPDTWTLYYDNRMVEWPSADFGSATPGTIDGSDLSAFATAFGENGGPVRWGFESGESPTLSPTFQADLAGTDYYLTGSDLSGFAADWDKSCGLSKVGDGDDVVTAMAWFGFTQTGRMIDIGGETVPEYALTDNEQRLIGISDPYGYRNSINSARSVPWGAVKELYR